MPLLDFITSTKCFCGKPNPSICANCRSQFSPKLTNSLEQIDQCWALTSYQGRVKSAVLAYKSGNRNQLPALIAGLGLVVAATGVTKATLVAIPSTHTKFVERGFETIGPLTRGLAKSLGWPVETPIRFAKSVSEQVGLSRTNRQQNLAQAFIADRVISGVVVLVDDIVTTGATASAAASALRIAGAQTIFQICLCRV